MSAEPLEILLHELRPLGEQDGPQHAKDAVDEAVKDAQESPACFHAASVSRNRGKASWGAGKKTLIILADS